MYVIRSFNHSPQLTPNLQIMFKMLVECDLITKEKEILHQNISPKLRELIKQNNADDLAIFPGEYS